VLADDVREVDALIGAHFDDKIFGIEFGRNP